MLLEQDKQDKIPWGCSGLWCSWENDNHSVPSDFNEYMLTKIEDYTVALFRVFGSYRSVEESFNMSDEGSAPSLGVARKKKIAIGVIFLLSPNEDENSKFQEFFFSHFPLFESHMNKLKSSIEQVL